MNTSYNTNRAAAVTIIALLLLGSAFLIYNSIRLSNIADRERLDKESLISEKIHLNKSLDDVRKEIAAANEKNRDIRQILESTRDRVDEKQKELSRLTQQVASLSMYRKKSADLEGKTRDLEQKILELNKAVISKKEEVDNLLSQVAAAKEEKLAFEKQIDELVKKPHADNYRTEAQRGRQNKLTVVARRTNKLDISIEVPSKLERPINFTITNPEGMTLSSSSDISSEVKIIGADAKIVAGTSDISASKSRVQLIYSPTKKLKKGIYKFQIFSGTDYLGSVQVRLR
ncbi:MAG: hypothetical protein D4R64_14960 [Porphyromonadaceae bacterium]|nr:MAG: hypothetical protein D4R64_14960 [Porphyromonadaceae bacterium]